jgi:hypothetical protein
MTNPLPSYLVDVLDPIYGFEGLVKGLPEPWTLRFGSTTGSASVFALYRTPSGAPALIGSGANIASPWVETAASDALVLKNNPTRFVQQTYALEGGAFLLREPAASVLRSGSIAAADGSERFLTLSALQLDGGGSRQGSNMVHLEFAREPLARHIVNCDSPKWNATTDYPDAWATAWSHLSRPNSPVTVASGQNWATAQLSGTWVIQWTEGRIQIDFRP